jgi:SAM-dependent methyltransferase
MAHAQQQAFVSVIKAAFPGFFHGGRVLEIGSLDINGSVRKHFADCDYIGLDVGPGPGVDVVCQGQDYAAPAGSFDVVISCETMEHNPFWHETFCNMLRLCRPGGLVLMTCASPGRAEHGTRRTTPEDAPLVDWDYYSNRKAADFTGSIDLRTQLAVWMFCTDISFCDLFFAGFRSGAAAPAAAGSTLGRIRRQYLIKNIRNVPAWRKQILLRLVGEQRYMAGSLLPWKRPGGAKPLAGAANP